MAILWPWLQLLKVTKMNHHIPECIHKRFHFMIISFNINKQINTQEIPISRAYQFLRHSLQSSDLPQKKSEWPVLYRPLSTKPKDHVIPPWEGPPALYTSRASTLFRFFGKCVGTALFCSANGQGRAVSILIAK